MKKNTSKKYISYVLSLVAPKFSVKTIFLLFTILLIIIQIYNGYEVYLLVDKVLQLLDNITSYRIEYTNLSFLSEFYVALHEAQPKMFSNSRALKAIAIGGKKLPVILLYFFFGLIFLNYFLIPDFKVGYYCLIGVHHFLLHKLLHFLQKQKHCKWYNCICWINRVKRFIKRKLNNTKN